MRTYESILAAYAETVVPGRLQLWKSGFLEPSRFPETVDTIFDQLARTPVMCSPRLFIETLGGAIGRVEVEATAYPHRRELMSLTVVARWNARGDSPACEDWVRRFKGALTPGFSGGVYVNYPDAELADWTTAYYGDNYPRLVDIKHVYDPEHVFRFAQSIGSDGSSRTTGQLPERPAPAARTGPMEGRDR
jgi:hypothetical protein